MASSRRLPGSILVACTVATAIVVALIASPPAHAAAVKPKPVVGQIVLDGGEPAPVTGFAWTVTADSSWTKGGGASVGKPNPGSLRVAKPVDAGSIAAFHNIVAGASFPTAVLTLASGKGNTTSTMVYEMTELFVTAVAQSAADGLTTEDLSMVFKTVKWTFTDASGGSSSGSWSVPGGVTP